MGAYLCGVRSCFLLLIIQTQFKSEQRQKARPDPTYLFSYYHFKNNLMIFQRPRKETIRIIKLPSMFCLMLLTNFPIF